MVWSDFFQLLAGASFPQTQAKRGFAEIASDGILNDLRCVGPSKPIGYLPLSTLIEAGWTQYMATDWARERSLKARVVLPGQSPYITSAVYVWDSQAMQALLDLNAHLVTRNGWTPVSEEFVEQLVNRRAETGSDLYQLIGYMFGDAETTDPLLVRLPEGHKMPQRGFSGLIWSSRAHEQAVKAHYSR
jgi:hypothetical protein